MEDERAGVFYGGMAKREEWGGESPSGPSSADFVIPKDIFGTASMILKAWHCFCWLTGGQLIRRTKGPGCSFIGYGAVVEIGPLLVNKNGEGLNFNTYSWNQASEINAAETYESDRIIDLPGQPSSPSVSHFSGYITVNEDHHMALFYSFFEAQSQLLPWLNGGSGCSSIGYGAVVEIGPLLVNKNGEGLNFNTYSWSQCL